VARWSRGMILASGARGPGGQIPDEPSVMVAAISVEVIPIIKSFDFFCSITGKSNIGFYLGQLLNEISLLSLD